jgi:2-keto-4-pentenoate hydratase/2-oxohepta-3-ene-1,7-dioic acid hydratase in catechol pathway
MFGIGMVLVDGRRTAVLQQGDELIDLGRALPDGGQDTLALLRNWDKALPALERLAASGERAQYRLSHGAVRWLPPVHYPDKVLCMAANYADHIREAGGEPHDPNTTEPYFFFKSPHNTLIGDGENIILPRGAQKMDWEVELAVVIGKRVKYVPLDQAMDCVAGYTILNDISRRERQRIPESRFRYDWVAGKCGDNCGPCGPVIVPRAFVPDWRRLRLRTLVNGVVMQDATAGEMLHTIPQQIAAASQVLTLEPGDIISTGTPAGVGAGRGQFLKPGDVVVTEIEGLGRLTNRCVADA